MRYFLILFLALTVPALAQDDIKAAKQWVDVATPGHGHKQLEPMVGRWKATTRLWFGGPQSEPVTSTGEVNAAWILGGRFLEEQFTGTLQMPGSPRAVPFEGRSLLGYDNYKKMFVGSWVDNMGTSLSTYRGSFNPEGTVLTMYGEMDEPMLGVQDRMVKYVTRITGPDRMVFEMYDLHAGADYKVMEIVYERRKEPSAQR